MPAIVPAGEVELRRLQESDACRLVAAMARSLPELRPWFPWAQGHPVRSEQVARLRAASAAFDRGDDFEFALVEVTAGGDLVGTFRLDPTAGPRTARIGFWVRSDRHRRGFATAATRALTGAGFAALPGIDRIEIHMDQSNRASIGVATRAGYHQDRAMVREEVAPGHTGQGWIWAVERDAWPAPSPDRAER